MENKINYDDNIFYLKMLIKNLSDIMKFDIDEYVFKNKITETLFFIDKSINYFYNSLIQSHIKIKRAECLRNIQKLKLAFVKLIDKILENDTQFSKYFKNYLERLKHIKEQHINHISEIKDIIVTNNYSFKDEENIISEEEFQILLKPGYEEAKK